MFGIAGVIAGVVLILLGGLIMFLFPGSDKYQPDDFSVVMVVVAIVMIILGGILVFV